MSKKKDTPIVLRAILEGGVLQDIWLQRSPKKHTKVIIHLRDFDCDGADADEIGGVTHDGDPFIHRIWEFKQKEKP